MPLVVKDFEWSETEEAVTVQVPLNGVPTKRVDIYANDVYIKANYPPYFFELDLFEAVNDEHSKVTTGEGYIRFQLIKTKPGLWKQCAMTAEDCNLHERRLEAFSRAEEAQLERKKAKETARFEEEQAMVKRQMEVERKERERIASLKQAEKSVAEASIKEWTSIVQEGDSLGAETKLNKFPQPRKSAEILVSFTPRVRPFAPARESKDNEFRSILEARAAAKGSKVDADQKAEEKNAVLMRDKGKSFFAKGNIDAAKNAFTAALQADPEDTIALSNRAACYLKLEDYESCIEDCSQALSLLQRRLDERLNAPQLELRSLDEKTKQSMIKVYARRGFALTQLKKLEQAAHDFKEAHELDPNDVKLKQDYEVLKARLSV